MNLIKDFQKVDEAEDQGGERGDVIKVWLDWLFLLRCGRGRCGLCRQEEITVLEKGLGAFCSDAPCCRFWR